MKKVTTMSAQDTSLDLLESENVVLLDLFKRIDECRGPSVEDRYDYGKLAKQVIRHLAIRQSSLMNVASGISSTVSLRPISDRMSERGTDRRMAYDEVGDLARNVQIMNLNQGQDFDAPFMALIDAVAAELDWEVTEAIPTIRGSLTKEDIANRFWSARYARRHAPTRLNVKGSMWYERVPIVSRFLTMYDHLKDWPASNHEKPRS